MHSRHQPDSERKPGRNRQLQEAIEAIVKDIPRGVHLTAPEVFRRAREQGLQVSLSTVYRTLNLLQAHGNVSTVAGEHGRRYEARDEDHDHLICLKCGLTIEFTDELIRGFGRAVAQRKGYEHASSRFDILGICSTCKAQDEDHKINIAIASLKTVAEQLATTGDKVASAITLLEARKISRAAELIGEISEMLVQTQVESEQAADVLTSPPKEII